MLENVNSMSCPTILTANNSTIVFGRRLADFRNWLSRAAWTELRKWASFEPTKRSPARATEHGRHHIDNGCADRCSFPTTDHGTLVLVYFRTGAAHYVSRFRDDGIDVGAVRTDRQPQDDRGER